VWAALITTLTGVLLMFYYEPTLTGAHSSLIVIDSVVFAGRFVRALHFWAAQTMVVAAVLHMVRIVFTGGYRTPRDFNWVFGLGLLVISLLWNFTGYVLRYDAGGIWALLVGTNLLKELPGIGGGLYRLVVGDRSLGPAALLRFYTWHVFGLAMLGVAGIGYHIWRVRVDGGISRPDWTGRPSRQVISRAALFFREIIAALIVTGGLVLLAAFDPPPLGPPADLSQVGSDVVLAPWFFLAIQGLLRYLPPLWAGWLIPMAGIIFLALLPLLDRRGPGRGRWFARERWRFQVAFGIYLIVIVVLTVLEWNHWL
jgi:quinol-cytochrome oxidoreductase complex cytochrome b subunit